MSAAGETYGRWLRGQGFEPELTCALQRKLTICAHIASRKFLL